MSDTVAKSDVVKYYSDIKSLMLGRVNWRQIENEYRGFPKAKFIIDRKYDSTASLLVYDFIVDLSQEYGRFVTPIGLEEGCISLNIAFKKVQDYINRDFRYLMLTNPNYHLLFQNYGVSKIYINGFPKGPKGTDNIDCSRFNVTALGQPIPY